MIHMGKSVTLSCLTPSPRPRQTLKWEMRSIINALFSISQVSVHVPVANDSLNSMPPLAKQGLLPLQKLAVDKLMVHGL